MGLRSVTHVCALEVLESMSWAQQRKCHKTTRSQDQGPIFFLMVSLHAYRNGFFTQTRYLRFQRYPNQNMVNYERSSEEINACANQILPSAEVQETANQELGKWTIGKGDRAEME